MLHAQPSLQRKTGAHWREPAVAILFILASGICAGLTLSAGGWGTALITLILFAAGLWTALQSRNRTKSASAVQASQPGHADLLLAEFERAGRGWLWETDRNGMLTYVSGTLASALGMDIRQLLGRPLLNLIDDESTGRERTLSFHLSSHIPFSDITVRAALSSDERWWSLSGNPFNDSAGRFAGFRGSGTDLTEMRQSQAELARLVQYDSLTGLSNRVQMRRTLDRLISDASGRPGDCVLMILNLARFKMVNDTLGHAAGDDLLRQAGQRLQRIAGSVGEVGRQGGDEFHLILPGALSTQSLADIARAAIVSLSQPYVIGSSKVVVGASLGIAIAPQHGKTTQDLIRNADLALHAAKAEGPGNHCFFEPAMHKSADDRRQLEHDLREAINSGGLHLRYQPVVCAATEQISGFEALLRWTHPERGEISPTLFVPIAEETGLIAQIGEWALRTACHEVADWPGDVRVAVNVSPIQFASPALPSLVMSALASSQLAPERLELEITEGVFLNDSDETDAMFANLKRLGVRLVLDDFGTGYSSLGYLKKAPFDKIKIDQSFVRGAAMPGNRNAAIITAIVSLAEALAMDTTAEGAETHDELNLIRSLGCSHIQGFIYGKPMTAREALDHLAGHSGQAVASGFRNGREQRRTMLRSTVLRHNGHPHPARIRNISAGGALVEGVWNIPEGTRFEVELAEDYVVQALVRWCFEDRCGLQFAEPVDLSLLAPVRPAALRRAG